MCELDTDLTEKLKKFRFAGKSNAAIICKNHISNFINGMMSKLDVSINDAHFCIYSKVKIDMAKQLVIIDEEFEVSANYLFWIDYNSVFARLVFDSRSI